MRRHAALPTNIVLFFEFRNRYAEKRHDEIRKINKGSFLITRMHTTLSRLKNALCPRKTYHTDFAINNGAGHPF